MKEHKTEYYNNKGEKTTVKTIIEYVENHYDANEITQEKLEKLDCYRNYVILKELQKLTIKHKTFIPQECNISENHQHICFYPSFDTDNNLVFTQKWINDDEAISINNENKKIYCLGTIRKC